MKISILIPCYNQEAHIREVVLAALNQTEPANEVIVVDDFSTDRSREIVKSLPVKLLLHEKNMGPAIARNTAFRESTGEFIIFLDADAVADSNMVAAFLDAFHLPSRLPIGGLSGRGIEQNIQTVSDRWRALHARQDFGLEKRDDIPFPIGLCMAFPRDAFESVGGFDPFYRINAGEDFDIGYRIKKAGYLLRYTPDAFVYHQHSDTEGRLKRIQYNWYYWGYLVKKRNHAQPLSLVAGSFRRLFADTLSDLIIQHDFQLARLDLLIFIIKLRAILNAAMLKNGV